MKSLGEPDQVNKNLINRIKLITISHLLSEDELRREVVNLVSQDSEVLDCGKSLRDYWDDVQEKSRSIETLDINRFGDYPDYLVDVCDSKHMKQLAHKYDFVIAFSLIEHCYNPFLACDNMFAALKKGGKLVGSAPFLFPRHSPKDLSYQDYFRFTRDSYAVLFPKASKIELFPLRGRVATALNVLTLRYRFSFERKFEKTSRRLNWLASTGENALHASGYGFIISK